MSECSKKKGDVNQFLALSQLWIERAQTFYYGTFWGVEMRTNAILGFAGGDELVLGELGRNITHYGVIIIVWHYPLSTGRIEFQYFAQDMREKPEQMWSCLFKLRFISDTLRCLVTFFRLFINFEERSYIFLHITVCLFLLNHLNLCIFIQGVRKLVSWW